MISIDGSQGEGGGQILRSSLSLALLTKQAFRSDSIRAGRRKPGLMRQHLAAIRAAQKISGARIEGDCLGSEHLIFMPGEVQSGDYSFAVGSAGSAMLVLQTVLIPLALANGPSTVTVEGGTHNAWAPPFEHFQAVFLPLLLRLGARVEVELIRHGFYPAGGGSVRVHIEPAVRSHGLKLMERGQLKSVSAKIITSNLPAQVGEIELAEFLRRPEWTEEQVEWCDVKGSNGPGNVVLIQMVHEHATEVGSAFGARGLPAKQVVQNAIRSADRHLASNAPVGEYLADQLLLPMAFLGGGCIRCETISNHTLTNAGILEKFLGSVIQIESQSNIHKIQVESN